MCHHREEGRTVSGRERAPRGALPHPVSRGAARAWPHKSDDAALLPPKFSTEKKRGRGPTSALEMKASVRRTPTAAEVSLPLRRRVAFASHPCQRGLTPPQTKAREHRPLPPSAASLPCVAGRSSRRGEGARLIRRRKRYHARTRGTRRWKKKMTPTGARGTGEPPRLFFLPRLRRRPRPESMESIESVRRRAGRSQRRAARCREF